MEDSDLDSDTAERILAEVYFGGEDVQEQILQLPEDGNEELVG